MIYNFSNTNKWCTQCNIFVYFTCMYKYMCLCKCKCPLLVCMVALWKDQSKTLLVQVLKLQYLINMKTLQFIVVKGKQNLTN